MNFSFVISSIVMDMQYYPFFLFINNLRHVTISHKTVPKKDTIDSLQLTVNNVGGGILKVSEY